MTLNTHGPFTVRELRQIAADCAGNGLPEVSDVSVATIPRAESLSAREQFREMLSDLLARGYPLVCLWSEGPGNVGHFIALVPRGKARRDLEVYDPESSALQFITGEGAREQASHYNADISEILKQALEKIDLRLAHSTTPHLRGALSFCPWGSQPPNSSSCGLHCLLRVAHRDVPPEAYIKQIRARLPATPD